MKTIYLLTFNNYYNRIIKGFDTLQEYIDDAASSQVFTGVNYKPNDGVITTFTFNMEVDVADYILVCNEYNEIISRWFIIESRRNAQGQWLLDVRRDVVYDYKNIILEAPCFIEKATLPASSPLIFNQEDFAANQIKTSETLLKDFTDCAWLVGYLNPAQSITNINVKTDNSIETEYIGDLETWTFYPYSSVGNHAATTYKNNYQDDLAVQFYVYYSGASQVKVIFRIVCYIKQGTYEIQSLSKSELLGKYKSKAFACPYSDFRDRMVLAAERVLKNLNVAQVNAETLPNVGDITRFQGQKLETENNIIYNTTLRNEKNQKINETEFVTNGAVYLTVSNAATAVLGSQGRLNPVYYTGTVDCYSLALTPETALTATFSLDASKNYTNDVYRIICIPFPDEGKEFRVTGATDENGEDLGPILINRQTAHSVAKAIMRAGGGSGASTLVYDFQLLPYCPIAYSRSWERVANEPYYIRLEGDNPENGHYTPIDNKCVIFEVAEPSFTFNIYQSIEVKDPKVENQLDSYRLCSPNYAAIFEFNAAKNGGVQYFNVDCTYKPYTPYIHVNPNFGGLYGQDFNDPRGLICSGDFSLSSLSDAFVNYELQNKNYQEIFDRGIQNMETVNKYTRKQERWQAATGTIQGAASGAMTGALASGGNPLGTLAGGIIGGGVALAGGLADLSINESLRTEALDYTKDMYGFNLENIKALPATLTKVSAFNVNNKIYPVLEYYTCTEVEREAFKNKIKYNGMTVGVIDTISNYLQVEPTYIKGSIIRLEGLEHDFHMAKVISDEIYKGVFI